MHATIPAMTLKRTRASSSIAHHCDTLSRLCSGDDFHLIRRRIHELNSRYHRRHSTPPDGPFSALDHYIDRCRRSVNAVDFKARAQYNNLWPAEKEALTRLSKRTDMVIKAADKGGAVVVRSRPLYIAEAYRQLSDGRFYERLDHDPLKENQNVVKTAITEMIRDNKLPPSSGSVGEIIIM